MGMQARPFMEKGKMVPDVIMMGLLSLRLAQGENTPSGSEVAARGFVLEGMPRNREQVYALQKKGLFPSHFVILEIPDEIILLHTVGTVIDPITNTRYHPLHNPVPPNSPILESRLIQRASDSAPAVKARLALYRRHLPGVLATTRGFSRSFTYTDGISFGQGAVERVVRDLMEYVRTQPVSAAPRSFRIVLAGLPGCGKTQVAKKLEERHGFVHVSPFNIIMEQMSQRTTQGKLLAPYLEFPEDAPETIMIELIAARLKEMDAVDRGWVLEGFPLTSAQSKALKELGLVPNRVIWFSCSPDTCINRLTSTHVVQGTGRLSAGGRRLQKAAVDPGKVRMRVERLEAMKADLETAYGYRIFGQAEAEGIMQEIDAEDIKEDRLHEMVEGALLRSIPERLVDLN
ncbi:P-loop containing nucleoside triphosphate hydrolase protein [Cladochytrium replicatum]|nr:P-loop containing nucleoside triphosphate hydrolase protein [Cladochytrium replicatum]